MSPPLSRGDDQMTKWIVGLVLAGAALATAGVLVWNGGEAKPEHVRSGKGRPPVEGDYWAVRLAYGGDPARMRFEPQWLLDAKRQDMRVASGVPAGMRTYARSADSAFALDPDAFTLLGPKPLVGQDFGAGSNAGRVNVIISDPDNPAIAYLGADGGGVWKTTNCCTAATTWEVKTDFPELSSMAIGDMTLDPNDSNIVYAGTGDLRYGSFSFGSAGLLKSTDKGETWQVLGEDVFNPFYGPSANGFPQYQSIGKVVVDPNDSDNVIVGTKTGLYFSYDAGTSWAGPCYTNAFSSGPGAQRQDMTALHAVDRGGSTVLYAGVGTRGLPTPVQPDLVNNGANGVYRAAMPASGCPATGDWTLLANGFPAGTGDGTPNTTRGRLELAVAPSNTMVLYAMFAHSANRNVLGVWRSNDGGDTWVQTTTGSNIPDAGGSQMWYDAGLTVSPDNPDVVFLSGVDLYRSSNGGTSFINLTAAYSGGPVHPDNHARAFVGGDPQKLLNGNDGGVYFLSNASTATSAFNATWIALNDTLPTIEVYHGDITANFAASASAGVAAGFQDNGSAVAVFSGDPSATPWTHVFGGDGIVSRIEPVLGQRWYASSQNGNVVVSTNGPNDPDSNAAGAWSSDVRSFIFPFDLYRHGELDAPGSGCTSAQGCTRLIAGSNRVWETTTGGVNGNGWNAKTGNLTKNNLILGSDNRSFINNLHYSVSDPAIAIVGTNDGNVQYVFGLGQAGAATAVNVTGANAVLPNRPIMDVATDPLDPLVGYAAVGGFTANTPATPGHVLQVTCTAQCASFNWVDKSGNLPDIPANAVIVNPHQPQQVFVGMDWGLYYTDDINAASPVWQRFEGLPHVMIWSLSIDRGFTTLAAYTRGRGTWAWPLPHAPTGDGADLDVTIELPEGPGPGLEYEWSVTVTNNGPEAASNVSLDALIPAGFALRHNSGDCTVAWPCTFAQIAPGASRTVVSRACVARDYAGPDPVVFGASVDSDTPDPVAANDVASNSVALMLSMFADGFDCGAP